MTQVRFSLGRIMFTPGALDAMAAAADDTFLFLLARHATGDWGDLDEFDKRQNERALVDGTRLMSVYELETGIKLWVITEADRSVTTFLLPNEY